MKVPSLYVVSTEGVYRHELLGVFHSVKMAKEVADDALLSSDGYHSFDVLKFGLNEVVEDGTVVYSACKSKEMTAVEFEVLERNKD